eukprot:TRINITY_DN3981_c0_g2_i1.p2 TRINITY_DN3981_c0_g2~~TRINITY_DN3981_c0_g2_i1.p2  ORF type:complete len:389 (+),score=136.18 TRINITY_DN3981_c0_g2_i1:67-1233(+)
MCRLMFWKKPKRQVALPPPKITVYPDTDTEGEWVMVDVGLDSYIIHGVVGRGATADVYRAECKCTGRTVALKVVDKRSYFGNNGRVPNPAAIMREREILQNLQDGWEAKHFCALYEAFQTERSVVLVQEYMPRGDLQWYAAHRQQAKQVKFMDEATVKFFAAQLCYALQRLHALHIVYRDLKLENILVDERFRIKLADFGLARYVTEGAATMNGAPGEAGTCRTFAGTAPFMAPEILRGGGYDAAVDWWSAGVVLYGLLTGKFPFWGKGTSSLYRAIVHDGFDFPDDAAARLSPECRDFVGALLMKAPCRRLTGGAVFAHPWFRDVSWPAVQNQTLRPPPGMYVDVPMIQPRSVSEVLPPRSLNLELSADEQRIFADFDYVGDCPCAC